MIGGFGAAGPERSQNKIIILHVNICLVIQPRGCLPLNLFLPSAGVCSRMCVLNNGESRVTECHVAGVYPCWDVGSPAAVTLTPRGTEIKPGVIRNTVRFVLLLKRFFFCRN